MRKIMYVFAGAVLMVPVSLALIPRGVEASPPPPPNQPVIVTNPSSQPVPVAGSIQATQSGSWGVSVTNKPNIGSVDSLPAISGTVGIDSAHNGVQVTNTTPIQVADGSTQIIDHQTDFTFAEDTHTHLVAQWDVSAFHQIRLQMQCDDAASYVLTEVANGVSIGELDSFTDPGNDIITKVYDTPGVTLVLAVASVNGPFVTNDHLTYAVFGR